ncbi:MAG: hypothetical protein ABI650_11760 [Dokdonella sp.]
MNKLFRNIGLFAALTVLVTGCASTPGARGASNVDPEVRAIERWNLLIAKKAELAYDYMTPGRRSVETREEYALKMNNRPVQWEKATLMSKQCDTPDNCKVTIFLDLQVPAIGMTSKTPSFSFSEEIWTRDAKGGWYFLGPASAVAK